MCPNQSTPRRMHPAQRWRKNPLLPLPGHPNTKPWYKMIPVQREDIQVWVRFCDHLLAQFPSIVSAEMCEIGDGVRISVWNRA
jgi:hypothetical protein